MIAKQRKRPQQRQKKRKKKKTWRNHLVTLLLILMTMLGLVLIFNDWIKNLLIAHFIGEHDLNNITSAQIVANEKKPASFDFDKVENLDFEKVLRKQFNKEDLYQLGGIAIPSISLNLPIYKGVSNYALMAGAGTMKADQKMGKGNYALAGHDMLQKKYLFSSLHDIKLGALVYITDLKDVYIYKVNFKEVISPHKTSIIADDEDGKIQTTLITCSSGGATRLAVQGEFQRKVSVSDAEQKIVKAFNLRLGNRIYYK